MKKLTLLCTLLALSLLPMAADAKTRIVHAQWEQQDDENIAGYRLYFENQPACETADPLATTMDCTVDATDGEVTFHLTSYTVDGIESPPSEPYVYVFSENLKAMLATDSLLGQSPLTVTFDATDSTGNILEYNWSFGDGETANGQTVSHTFSTEGSYTVELKVVNDLGATDRELVTVAVTTPTADNTPPIGVLSSSTSVGEAPLAVHFDGSSSSDSDGSIVQYQWDMGDGTTVSGAQYDHTYTDAGMFTATLTVTDNGGLSDTISTPVIVSQPQEENVPPNPVITVSTTGGPAPLPVVFDGSGSQDADGSISSYSWNFGDGITASGVSPSHIYAQPANYTVTLDVTDDRGASARTTATIIVAPEVIEPAVPMEVGEILLSSDWQHVDLAGQYVDPVVIVSPLSYNGSDPAVIRLHNVDENGFDIRIQEWNYLDDSHVEETAYYIVMEQGSYTMADGSRIEAGSFTNRDQNFQRQNFNAPFQVAPVVMTSVATYNGGDAITGRLRRISTENFEYKLSEQESKRKTGHVEEIVGYIAWEPGIGDIGTVHYEIGVTGDAVTHDWYEINLQPSTSSMPHFFAAMQSTDGGDTSAIRYHYLSTNSAFIFVEEETSRDNEINHTTENVGYMVFGKEAN